MKNIQVSPLIYEMVVELQRKYKKNNPKLVIEELVRIAYNSK
jgi:hypothetical protein